MDAALLHALRDLFLGAIPTILLFLTLWAAYNSLVHKPLQGVLEERHDRSAGAIAKAKADVELADARTAEYEKRLRDAKAQLFKAQEARRRQLMEARAAALAQVHAQAQKQVRDARAALDREVAEARTGLQAEGERLAAQVIQAVLKPAAAARAGGAA